MQRLNQHAVLTTPRHASGLAADPRVALLRSVAAGLVLLLLVQGLMAVPAVAEPGRPGAQQAGLAFEDGEREAMLRRLARPIMECFDDNPQRTYTMFHGCGDWHSAVHAAYSLYAIYRRTGDPQYLAAVEAEVRPELFDTEMEYMQSWSPTFETPYGVSWFLMTVRERELATSATDMRPLAEWSVERLKNFMNARTPETARQGVLANQHGNLSFSLINMDTWARHTNDTELRGFVREKAEAFLFEPELDESCPASKDARFSHGQNDFFPPCLLRLAAVARIFGTEQVDWITERIPDSFYVASLYGNDHQSSHESGLNWARAFSLWWIQQATNQPMLRMNAVKLLKDHLAQPYHWDVEAGHGTYHFVPQFGVRMINESFEPDLDGPAGQPIAMPAQIALGDSWAADTGARTNPASHGYVELLRQTMPTTRSEIRLLNLGTKAESTGNAFWGGVTPRGGTLIDDHLSLQVPFAVGVLNLARDTEKEPGLITIHTGFDSTATGRYHLAPNQSTSEEQVIATCEFYASLGILTFEQCWEFFGPTITDIDARTAALAETAESELADVRAKLSSMLSQLRSAAPKTTIVIGTYDNVYPSGACDDPSYPESVQKMAALVEAYLEGGEGFGIGLNGVIREVAREHNAAVGEVYGLLNEPTDWDTNQYACYNPSAAGHAKIAQAFVEAGCLDRHNTHGNNGHDYMRCQADKRR